MSVAFFFNLAVFLVMPLIILVFFFILMLFEAAGHLIFVFIISTQKYKIVVKIKTQKKQVKQ